MNTPDCPAVQRARREGLTEIPVVLHELISAAQGHPIIVSTATGEEALLRLATADEVQQWEREARRRLEAEGIPTPDRPLMSRARAEDLSAPLDLGGLR